MESFSLLASGWESCHWFIPHNLCPERVSDAIDETAEHVFNPQSAKFFSHVQDANWRNESFFGHCKILAPNLS